jgi:hypothetical protein
MFAAAIPTQAAFSSFESSPDLKKKKKRSYFTPLITHGIILIFFYYQEYYTPFQLVAVSLGFFWGLIAENSRIDVFLRRIRLQSLTSAYSAPDIAVNHGMFGSVLGLGSAGEYERWDIQAQRKQVCARSFFSPKPFIFISYGWKRRDDREFAFALKKFLDSQGIPAFLDKDPIAAESIWRAAIAENILRSTHFLFLISRQSIRGRTCTDEVRFAIELLGFSNHTSISLCVLQELNDEDFLRVDPAFRYLWERAAKVDPMELLTSNGLTKWLYTNRPSWWLRDAGICH